MSRAIAGFTCHNAFAAMNDPKPAKSPHPIRRAWLTLTVAVSLLMGASLRADDYVLERFADFLEQLRIQAGIPGARRPRSSAATTSSGSVPSDGRISIRPSPREPTRRFT